MTAVKSSEDTNNLFRVSHMQTSQPREPRYKVDKNKNTRWTKTCKQSSGDKQ